MILLKVEDVRMMTHGTHLVMAFLHIGKLVRAGYYRVYCQKR